MAYATLAALKASIDLTGAGDDTVLESLLSAAEQAVNNYCGRPDGFEADTSASDRYYAGTGDTVLQIDECVEITAVAVKDTASDTDFTAWTTPSNNWAGDGDWFAYRGDRQRPNFNPIAQKQPYTGLMIDPNGNYSSFTAGQYVGRGGFRPIAKRSRTVFTVKVTAKWGYASTVPDVVTQSTIMLVARWYKRLETQMGDALANAELGEIRYTKTLDPDVKFLLEQGRLIRRSQGRI